MKSKSIILASASPRRKALLAQIGIPFNISISSFTEDEAEDQEPHAYVQKQALGKATDVAKNYHNAIIIGADTTVAFNGTLLGKPLSPQKAAEMLTLLSGNPHKVITGYSIIDAHTNKTITDSVETTVWLKKLTTEEIDWYVATGEPLDKAGAYAIQEKGGLFVEKLEGDYFNVVGLPIPSLIRDLSHFGIHIPLLI